VTIAKNNTVGSEILSAIRRNLAASSPFDAIRREHRGDPEIGPPRPAQNESRTAAKYFCESIQLVGGKCSIASHPEEASVLLQTIVTSLAPRGIAVSDSALVNTLAGELVTNAELLKNASAPNLFGCDVGITSAQWAIAETGTVILESEKEFTRLTSLVPAVHICILEAEKIRQTMAEILELLGRDLSPSVTFITGPSRTSDIELTLAIGVHGPRELYVIVIGD
jgi:L-lactate dehydrogenase complex protein LldG